MSYPVISAVGIGPNPAYTGYSDAKLEETHSVWLGIHRKALNREQRERAARNLAAVATELRRRRGVGEFAVTECAGGAP